MDNGLRRRKDATDVSGISRDHQATTRCGSDSKSKNEQGFIEQLLSGTFGTRRFFISSGITGQIKDQEEEDIDKIIDETMRQENERR